MSHAVSISLEGTRIPLSRDAVAAVARGVLRSERVKAAMLSITFVTSTGIRTLNRRHLRRHRTTDVIAFGFRSGGKGGAIVGDVYISPDAARASARENGVSVREEIIRLVVHGTLHVLGYDHPESDARTRSAMWKRQERLVKKLSA